ncbi:MAG: thioesterase family protein, partial [Candidatus Rokuibacteriota bacterium]
MDWLETYRGTVFRWEVDHNDHLTVAYYFTRIADAAAGLLGAVGLAAAGARTTDCFVRYQRELRVGDIMHVESGVIGVAPDALVLGHKLYDSGARVLCTTVEQRVRLAAPLAAEVRLTPDEVAALQDAV